jgi:ring-1,2-phenylacetyl-CoA epoxidase subunit PaaA
MYSVELKSGEQQRASPAVEDPAHLAAFEARVAADAFIEPKDWMP